MGNDTTDFETSELYKNSKFQEKRNFENEIIIYDRVDSLANLNVL